MRYILYILTMVLLFTGGMLVGNNFLPMRDTSLASSVSVPDLSSQNPTLQTLTREQAQKDLEMLVQALNSCPAVVSKEKDHLLRKIRLRLAIEEFELKKTILALEMAKNHETNRPTTQLIQASTEYAQAKDRVEKLADELFPPQSNSQGDIPPAQDTPIVVETAQSAQNPVSSKS